jgi:riboflavin biosynthesis pyrimidine reductase
VDLGQALGVLADIGLGTLLVEGGSRVLTSFLEAEAVDRVIASIAPVVLGSGIDAVADLGSERISDGLQLRDRVVRQVGDDVVIAGTPARAHDASLRTSLRLLPSGSAAGA